MGEEKKSLTRLVCGEDGGISGLLKKEGRVAGDRFHIEIDGRGRLLIEGSTGVRSYDDNVIRIGTGRLTVMITGCELCIGSMCGDTVCVSGCISGVEFI